MGGKELSLTRTAANKRALITGIAGQDGSYLAELLLSRGYHVVGVDLNETTVLASVFKEETRQKVDLRFGDVGDLHFVEAVIKEWRPDEIYHLAARTLVSYRLEDEASTLKDNLSGTHNILIKTKELVPKSRFFFAASSEIFGAPDTQPQNLNTPFAPRSVYGVSKLSCFHLVKYYRNYHALHASNGILYNHESPRRGANFVTQKIATGAARIKLGQQTDVVLGNLDSKRDWGHAVDFVEGIWRQIQQESPSDLIFSTGNLHTVREFAERAFYRVGLDYKKYIRISDEFFRPVENVSLVGDNTQAKEVLEWSPSYCFEDIVFEMVDEALKRCSMEMP